MSIDVAEAAWTGYQSAFCLFSPDFLRSAASFEDSRSFGSVPLLEPRSAASEMKEDSGDDRRAENVWIGVQTSAPASPDAVRHHEQHWGNVGSPEGPGPPPPFNATC